jgi:hypothetical protein
VVASRRTFAAVLLALAGLCASSHADGVSPNWQRRIWEGYYTAECNVRYYELMGDREAPGFLAEWRELRDEWQHLRASQENLSTAEQRDGATSLAMGQADIESREPATGFSRSAMQQAQDDTNAKLGVGQGSTVTDWLCVAAKYACAAAAGAAAGYLIFVVAIGRAVASGLGWVVLVAMLAPPSHAQTVPVDAQAGIARRIKAASVRVRVDADRGHFYGSGVHVAYDGYKFVVTNFHVIEGNVGAIAVLPVEGEWVACTVLGTDQGMDLAVLSAADIDATPVRTTTFQSTHRYTAAGFAGDGVYHVHALKPRKWTGVGLGAYSWVEFSGTCCQGDSGGGIFSARGEVIGVVWGKGEQGGSHVMGTVGLPFRNLLSKAVEELR